MAPKQNAKKEVFRAFIAVLKPLLLKYHVRDAESVNRDVSHETASKFYKKLLLKVHPDKPGGNAEDFRKLQAAKESFDAVGGGRPARATRAAGPGGAGQPGSAHPFPERGVVEASGLCEFCGEDSGEFRVEAKAVLLTYNGVDDMSVWESFKTAVAASLKAWTVKYYGATLEECKNHKLHVHLMLQFHNKVDEPRSTFEVLGLKPNVRPGGGDYLHQKWTGDNAQTHIDRGFFYVRGFLITRAAPCHSFHVMWAA